MTTPHDIALRAAWERIGELEAKLDAMDKVIESQKKVVKSARMVEIDKESFGQLYQLFHLQLLECIRQGLGSQFEKDTRPYPINFAMTIEELRGLQCQ